MAIHPTAVIDPKAEIDSSVEIGPYCIIDANVAVAAGCKLYQGVYLTGWTTIGENCTLHPGAIVGHAPQDTKYSGERAFCRIGKNTIIREYAVVHRGTEPESETRVGNDCFLMGGCHVAHNCVVGNRVTLVNNVLLAGHVQIGDNTTLGGSAGIHQFVRIGELAMIRGRSEISMDFIPFAMSDGEGRVVGLNRVGIRRAEITPEEIKELRMAYRTLFSGGLPFTEAIARVAGEATTPAGRRLATFLQGPSKRGIAGRSKRTRNDKGNDAQ